MILGAKLEKAMREKKQKKKKNTNSTDLTDPKVCVLGDFFFWLKLNKNHLKSAIVLAKI